MTDQFRAMCAELVDAVDLLCGSGDSPGQPGSRLILTVHVEALDELANRARALLAQPVAEGPTDEALLDLADDSDLDRFEGERSYPDGTVIKEGCWEAWDHQLLAFARAVLARWGHPTFQPPADGEVGELVELQWPASVAQGCHEAAVEAESGSPLQQLLVAAGDLLERLASPACLVLNPSPEALSSLKAAGPGIIEAMPAERTVVVPAAQPVAVSERPWERKGWCDEQGRCWMGDPGGGEFIPSWRLCRAEDAPSMKVLLPANALPTPEATND